MRNKLFNIFLLVMGLSVTAVGVSAEETPNYTTSIVQANAIDWNNLDAPIGLSADMNVDGLVDLVGLPGVEITASDWNQSVSAKPVAIAYRGSGDYWLYNGNAPHYVEINFNQSVDIQCVQNFSKGHPVIIGGWGAKSEYTSYQYSNDGETWTDFAVGSSDKDGHWFNVMLASPITARYLRVAGNRGATIGIGKLRVWGTSSNSDKHWVDVERYWGNWAQGSVSSNTEFVGGGCNAVTAAADVYSNSYSFSKAPDSGNVYIQFQLPKLYKLSRARVIVNEIYPQSAQNFTIYGSLNSNSGDFIKLAEVGSTPLNFGEFNYIDLDCPVDIKYVTIVKSDADTSEGALSFCDVKFEEDTSMSGGFAVYNKISDGKKYSLGDTNINTYLYKKTDIIEEEGSYLATFAYYAEGDGDHNVFPLVGIFDENDKLMGYNQLKLRSGNSMVNGMAGNSLRTFEANIDVPAGTSAVKCFATAKRSSTGDTPVQGAPFAGAAKIEVMIEELID